jgi:hypothetical protein
MRTFLVRGVQGLGGAFAVARGDVRLGGAPAHARRDLGALEVLPGDGGALVGLGIGATASAAGLGARHQQQPAFDRARAGGGGCDA